VNSGHFLHQVDHGLVVITPVLKVSEMCVDGRQGNADMRIGNINHRLPKLN